MGRDIAGLKASSFAGASNVRLGDRKSVTDYAHRRIIDQSARRRLSPGPVDFMAINNSNRRDRLGTYWLQFNTLRDKRTGDENRPLFNFLLTFRSLVGVGSASTVPANMLAATRTATLEDISVFTN